MSATGDTLADQYQQSTWSLLLSMGSLLTSYALLMAGTGLFSTFIGLRAELEGFSTEVIGTMAAAHYAGLVAGSLRCGQLINRVGHIRAFAAFSSIIASAVLLFPFVPQMLVWIALRAVIGFNTAGVFMVAESWLNHKATPTTRGTLLSMYMVTSYLAMGGGQLLINAGEVVNTDLFMLASMLFGLALVPVAITRATHPAPVESTHFGLRRLYTISPVAVMACIGSGLCTGSIWGLGAVFGKDLGMTTGEISGFMSAIVFASLAFQIPIGRLSDRFDRRKVILGVTVASALSSGALVGVMLAFIYRVPFGLGDVFLWINHRWAITGLAALYGGFVSTLYPLSVAYANDYVETQDLVPASAGLVLTYGVGAAIGPVGAGLMMKFFGPSALFSFSTGVVVLLAAFVGFRMRKRTWAPVIEKDAFVALPEATSTPTALEADPRGEVEQAPERPRWMSILDRRSKVR
ncbi:MAG: MFS transporter [Gammaproteobacteria bacterium]|nr:MFS transporter [Gammaproteobacteria bacterium]